MRSERNQQSSSSSGGGTSSGAGTSGSSGNDGGPVRSGGSSSTSGVASGGSGSSVSASDRDAFSRWRDRQYYGPRRWFTSRDESGWEKETGLLYIIQFFFCYVLSIQIFCPQISYFSLTLSRLIIINCWTSYIGIH